MSKCHCGKDGHALNSINCSVHGGASYARGLADGRSDAELDLANSAVLVVALVRAMTDAAERLETALLRVAHSEAA